MWALDRLSSHSTPPPSRPYSPAPRRSNLGPARPPLRGGDSTLSLISPSTSYTQLPNTARILPRSSSLSAPPVDAEDPSAALDRLLGASPGDVGTVARPSTFDSDIAFDGLSLQAYVEHEASALDITSDISQYSHQPVEEYEEQRDKFEDLHKSISGCDDVLQSVEKYLSSFQTDLAAVSAEIETLQTRSTSMNEKLQNRRKVEKLLGPTVERVTISPRVVKKISEGPVDEAYVHALDEMQRRRSLLDSADELHPNVKAAQDLRPLFNDLQDVAVERIRDYFAAQIRALRSPNINAQILQQQRFSRFQPLFAFLADKQPQLAAEIMQAYSNTMRWYYESHFTRYYASLSKLKLFVTDRHDVLGEDPAAAAKARGSSSLPRTDAYSLARRMDILKGSAGTAMPSHAAEETKASHHIETPFLAYNLALIDNASFEYSFLTSFFSTRSTFTKSAKPSVDHSTIIRHFSIIFTPVINLATTLTKDLITDSYDALGILLFIRLIQHFAFALQRRKVPTLDFYINGTNILLWPKFQTLLDANCASLKSLTSSLPNRPSGTTSAAGTLASMSGSSASSSSSTAPHPVTQRFANLVRGIIDLSAETGDDEPVSASLRRLRNEFESFLTKLGASFPAGEKGRKERKRLLVNNYTLVLAVVGEARGRLGEEMRGRFEELKEEVA